MIESDRKQSLFAFTSEGPRGSIQKRVQYTETHIKNLFNLGFGDEDETTGKIHDTVITNNGDSQKVLATVAATIYLFSERHPNAWVFIKGNNKVRTRLYRIAITVHLTEIEKDFHIFGLINEQWQEYSSADDFEAFLIKRKN